jgi:hypothetical protein
MKVVALLAVSCAGMLAGIDLGGEKGQKPWRC